MRGADDMADQTSSAEDLQDRLITRAWEDERFKRTLLTDPKSAIGEELGVELPRDLDIEVFEETPNKIFLVLPARPEAVSDDALSDEQLESVAGGIGGGGGGTVGPIHITPNAGIAKLGVLTTTMPRFRGR
jgi:hypothetical protein